LYNLPYYGKVSQYVLHKMRETNLNFSNSVQFFVDYITSQSSKKIFFTKKEQNLPSNFYYLIGVVKELGKNFFGLH